MEVSKPINQINTFAKPDSGTMTLSKVKDGFTSVVNVTLPS